MGRSPRRHHASGIRGEPLEVKPLRAHEQAYLTIDDCPSPDFVGKREFLRQAGIPALLFCEGRAMAQFPEETITAIRQGFVIGNHSWSHPHFSDIGLGECLDEIRRTDALIDDLHRQAGMPRTAHFFRFPFFDAGGSASGQSYEAQSGQPPAEPGDALAAKRQAIQDCLKELGYRQPAFAGIKHDYFADQHIFDGVDVRCTFDQMEYWLGNTQAPYGMMAESAILGRIEEDVPHEGRPLNRHDTTDVILVHDHTYTTPLFYRIIARYLEKGIKFLAIPLTEPAGL